MTIGNSAELFHAEELLDMCTVRAEPRHNALRGCSVMEICVKDRWGTQKNSSVS